MMRKRIVIGMAVLAMALLGLSLYAWHQAALPASAGPVEKIVFGTTTTGLFAALVWVAEQEGYFQHAGLDVEIREFSSAHVALKTMLLTFPCLWQWGQRRRETV